MAIALAYAALTRLAVRARVLINSIWYSKMNTLRGSFLRHLRLRAAASELALDLRRQNCQNSRQVQRRPPENSHVC